MWCKSLFTSTAPSPDEGGSAGSGPLRPLLAACTTALQHDLSLALYLLPVFVLEAVGYGPPSAREEVMNEIWAVVENGASGVGGGEGAVPAGTAGGGGGDAGQRDGSKTELALGVIFNLLGERKP